MRKKSIIIKFFVPLMLLSNIALASPFKSCPPISAFHHGKYGYWLLSSKYKNLGWEKNPDFLPDLSKHTSLDPNLPAHVFLSSAHDTMTIECQYRTGTGELLASAELYFPSLFSENDLKKILKKNPSFKGSPPGIQCYSTNKAIQTKCFWGL